ncbi:DUF294 nucleotidyltransferase-like domain-containing protein [Desulfovibrio mangrovi]|uniref:putative nucleotidyltransferase substrate binding domain-containing protein n=1 Tax=Desulfovibrio mangrovi TaxID=2976983 RepID=UPI002246FEF4|nr:putative nucleotidyltransferase substrate binding domain-containing protein [Desulfovibrio mangrovi]UZP67201.1 DUF294 nucleotidyltransferase-like domain-containing protein [Desulfovibrio mangrovi]
MADPSRQPQLALDFLRGTLPFSELSADVLGWLAKACSVDFMPSGTRLFERGRTRPDRLWLVQKGAVRLTGGPDAESTPQTAAGEGRQGNASGEVSGSDSLTDVRGEGASVGAVALMDGGFATADVETVEDTFFITIPRAVFLELVEREQVVSQYYMKGLPERFVSKAFAEMRVRCEGLADEKGLYLFASRVGDLVSRPPVSVVRGTSLRQAAACMVEQGVGSLLIREGASEAVLPAEQESGNGLSMVLGEDWDERLGNLTAANWSGGERLADDSDGEIIGIVTDSDLRKAVSLCMDYGAPVETLMNAPVVAMDAERPCFDGLLEMMRRQIHHLCVTRNGRIVGVITAHDIMVMQGRTPMSLFREIMHQRTLEGLHPLGQRVAHVVRGLVEEGARAGAITRMITVFNDLMLEKVLSLLQRELGPAPVPFCWMCMGSEGRREQTFMTDQDNALIIRDTEDPVIRRAAEFYFAAFAEQAVHHLDACGFKRCKGDMMASNPRWRMEQAGWAELFGNWIRRPEPEQVLNSSIFFDFRSGYGRSDYVDGLWRQVLDDAASNELFQRHLAADCLRMRPPLSFFRSFIVEKDGQHRNTLDLKKRGGLPFVDFARVMALRHGLRETNTMDRLLALEAAGHVPAQLGREARDAYEFVMHLRLVHQVGQIERGEQPDNHINPATLTDLEKQTLKEAFAVAVRLQSFLKEMFHMHMG